MKIRKTRDEFHIMTNYGYGLESECVESTMKAAKATVRDYLDNANLQEIKIKKVRVKNYLIKTYFQTVSIESSKIGDFSECGHHDSDELDSVQDAIDFLKRKGGLEPSSSQFHAGIWYTTIDSESDIKTGDETNYTYHLYNYSDSEQLEIFNAITKQT